MQLSEKIRQIKEDQKEKNETNLEKNKEEWIHSISDVFQKIRDWLTPFKEDIDIQENSLTLEEEGLGTYNTLQLILNIGNFQIVFKPFGAILIGAWGRIDIYKIGYIDKGYMLLKFKDSKTKEFYWQFCKKSNTKETESFTRKGVENILNNLL